MVPPGESIATTAQALTDAGFISDPLVFTYHVVTRGLDDQLQVGSFNLDMAMTPAEIAQRLALPPDPPKAKIVLGFRIALRLEQMAAYLQAQKAKGLEMDVGEFLDLVRKPPQELRDDYPALKEIPKGRTLEGFMGQGVFEVDADITPDALVRLLLDDWQEDIGPDVIERAKKSGQDFYEVVTVASLVERETGEDSERDKIAGVYLNRLDPTLNPTGIMNADPTVIYAVDTMELREKIARAVDEVRVLDDRGQGAGQGQGARRAGRASRRTRTPGCRTGPSPRPRWRPSRPCSSPDTKAGNLFFYACPGSTTHKFAKTLAQQQRNINSCRRERPSRDA